MLTPILSPSWTIFGTSLINHTFPKELYCCFMLASHTEKVLLFHGMTGHSVAGCSVTLAPKILHFVTKFQWQFNFSTQDKEQQFLDFQYHMCIEVNCTHETHHLGMASNEANEASNLPACIHSWCSKYYCMPVTDPSHPKSNKHNSISTQLETTPLHRHSEEEHLQKATLQKWLSMSAESAVTSTSV